MRAFDLNFARAARIFDPNFMRAGRKAARPRGKIFSGEKLLRSDEILNGGEILSDLALGVGKIPSGSGILSDDGILSLTSRGGIRRGFSRRVLRGLRGETSLLLHLRRKFQSANGSQTDYKFKRVVALQTDRKFKMALSLRTACKFKAQMQKFHRGSCAAAELLRQKFRSETVLRNCLEFQSPPYALARLKFQNAAAAFARSKFRGSPQAAQRRKIRAQGQGG